MEERALTSRRRGGGWLLLALALAAAGCGSGVPPHGPQSPAPQGVSGRVVDGAGRGVAGAYIEARSLQRPPQPLIEIGVLSGADGRFRWPLPPGGRAALRARLGQALSCEVGVEPGAEGVVLTLGPPAAACAPVVP